MIAFLKGKIIEALPTQVLLDVHDVGYQILIPLSTYDKLPLQGSETKLLTHLHVREDAHVLYGFASAEERDLFRLLTSHVSGVGPKLALAILSGTTPATFKKAVVHSDAQALTKIKGLGKKTAERIIVELRDKMGVSAAWEAASSSQPLSPTDHRNNDALLALISLGYKQPEAHQAIQQVLKKNPSASVENLIREALKEL